jgi:hypothetical protein
MTKLQRAYGPDMTIHDLHEFKKPIQNWDDLLLSSRELAEGVFSIMINEDFGMYVAWEKMGPEQEKRIKHLMAKYLEREILERF